MFSGNKNIITLRIEIGSLADQKENRKLISTKRYARGLKTQFVGTNVDKIM